MMRSHQHITLQKAKHDPSIVPTRGRLNRRSLNFGQGFRGGGEEWRELLGWRWQLACCFNEIARLLTVRLLRLGSEDKI